MARSRTALPGANSMLPTTTDDLSPGLQVRTKTIDVSFEATEQGTHKAYFGNQAVTILRWRGFVTKPLAGTDAGTVIIKNAAGTTMTAAGGSFTTWSIAASTVYGAELGWQTITGNNTIAADAALQLAVAKTTAGGRAQIEIEYRVDS